VLGELDLLNLVNARLEAAQTQRMFNLMHLASGIKLDFIFHKSTAHRLAEFARRQRVALGGVHLWIASREDLILSKLLWAKESGSELQRRDARSLLSGPDRPYLERWAVRMGIEPLLQEIGK